MSFVIPGVILLFCAPAFFAEARMIKAIVILAAAAFVLGALACAWARFMPADFLTRHPAFADTPLHPVMASVMGGVFLLFGLGLFLALGCRAIYAYLRVLPR